MIKELLINGAVNRFATTNRARQAIAFQYITDTKTLRLLDTYTNTCVDLIAGGDNALTSSAMLKIWLYIQEKVDTKVHGAFKFRGNAEPDENGYPNVSNPKAGDVYQISVETYQYDPNTGLPIPSTVQINDKEFAWAETVDPNTGLPTGGLWVELGFNMSSDLGIVTKLWIEEFVQTKQQAAIEHGEISTYIDTVSTSLKGYVDITASNLSTYIDTTAEGLSAYVDNTAEGLSAYVDTTAEGISAYIDTTSTLIIYYVNEKVGELSTAIDDLRTYSDEQDAILNLRIDVLSAALDAGIQEAKDYADEQVAALSGDVYNTINNMSGVIDVKFDTMKEEHIQDLTFYEYDNEGNLINHGGVLPIVP